MNHKILINKILIYEILVNKILIFKILVNHIKASHQPMENAHSDRHKCKILSELPKMDIRLMQSQPSSTLSRPLNSQLKKNVTYISDLNVHWH